MTDIRMPKLSDSMEEGLVLQWLIEDGRSVKVGDELVEIETDKATMTYESEAEGVLSVVVPAGTTVPVGEVIARVGATVERTEVVQAPVTNGAPPEDPPVRSPVAPTRSPVAVSDTNGAQLATPVARRLAATHGIELVAVQGTGPRGRITKADVLSAAGVHAAAAAAPPPASPPSASPPPVAAPGLTRTQQLIARRMAESKATVPHFQVQCEVAMDRALALRDEIKLLDNEPIPSINDLIVRASALALRNHPRANGSYKGDRFELHEQVNIGIAVATDGALIVPTVFDADRKRPHEIAAETRLLAERVRNQTVTPPELSGATFTVSNLGMYGMTAIMPVINTPQAAILGVGAIRDTLARDPVTQDIVDRKLLTLTLSCDHRILYGADAARFLAEIKALLETPIRLLI
jgi:pyruvate dehydrogenase E2 component (dihydrolipoamide acetyltransferase)